MTSPRDPGKIAGAFPSRAQGLMANLRGFHEQVMALDPGSTQGVAMYDPAKDPTYVANNPHSEAAMRVAANGGKTSRPSPARSSGATRSQLTGVTERTSRQGWTEAHALPHLCFPPDQYPQGVGPGSLWNCRCDAVWRSDGIAWDEYPTEPARNTTPLKPERWFYQEGGQLAPEDYAAQEGLYDWRPLGPYYVKLYRAMLDNQVATMEGRMRDTTGWRELG